MRSMLCLHARVKQVCKDLLEPVIQAEGGKLAHCNGELWAPKVLAYR